MIWIVLAIVVVLLIGAGIVAYPIVIRKIIDASDKNPPRRR